ncbi:MAG: hypothetical protein KKE16_06615 [Firmicutes bacterium]|nr:hypothetical protein [Bacillota bacterium]
MEFKIHFHHIGFGSEMISRIEFEKEKEEATEEMLFQYQPHNDLYYFSSVINPYWETLIGIYSTLYQNLFIR